MTMTSIGLAALAVLFPGLAMAAGNAPHVPGAELGLVWVLPFVGILLSIAIMPLMLPRFWHHHFGKVSAFWALSFLVPLLIQYGPAVTLFEILHVGLFDYIPFIILLLALFTVAGGIRLKGSLVGTPLTNTGLLAFGTLIAGFMGTTGAAMLMIRPMIRANELRRHRTHIFVFFIFLVANIGGSLTPLGDPPLFLGFLRGVEFFWFTEHLIVPMGVASAILLAVFYLLDRRAFAKEPDYARRPSTEPELIAIEGGVNVVLLAGVIAAVLLSGVWRPGIALEIFHTKLELQNVVRDLLLIGITFASLKLTHLDARRGNDFSWGPIVEVAKLFAGIFLTIIPPLAILRAGEAGALGAIISFVNPAGVPAPDRYFWFTGILSSFLDNAPTFLVFFNAAGGDPANLMGALAPTLAAISAGAVFMGANSYIGNAPNFMVKAVVEERGIKMPSFFGYMGWSCTVLIPLFILLTFIFFR